MKKLLIVGGIAGLVYYLFFYSSGPNLAKIPSVTGNATGAGTLNNPVAQPNLGGVTLGPSFSQKVPGVASVS